MSRKLKGRDQKPDDQDHEQAKEAEILDHQGRQSQRPDARRHSAPGARPARPQAETRRQAEAQTHACRPARTFRRRPMTILRLTAFALGAAALTATANAQTTQISKENRTVAIT